MSLHKNYRDHPQCNKTLNSRHKGLNPKALTRFVSNCGFTPLVTQKKSPEIQGTWFKDFIVLWLYDGVLTHNHRIILLSHKRFILTDNN